MSNQDTIKRKKLDNRQPDAFIPDNPCGVSLAEQGKGLLIIPEGAREDLGEKRCVREHHNAGHALCYLAMAVHALIHETPSQMSQEKTRRIIGHLTCLREFLPNEDPQPRSLVTSLLEALKAESPDTYAEWLSFIHTQWQVIRVLAERYGSHDKCFPMSDYSKISDLVHNKQWRRSWWWEIKRKRILKGITHTAKVIKEKIKKGGAK